MLFCDVLWWYQIQNHVVSHSLNLDCSYSCWCWQTDVAVLFEASCMQPGLQGHATWQGHGTKSLCWPDQDCPGWDTAGASRDRHDGDVGRQTLHMTADLQDSCCGQLQWTEPPSCSRCFVRLERISKHFIKETRYEESRTPDFNYYFLMFNSTYLYGGKEQNNNDKMMRKFT